MDSISRISPVSMSNITTNAGDNPGSVDMASIKLALDAQKAVGQQIVKMLENLGNTIDTYA
jgi:hypothetical protein